MWRPTLVILDEAHKYCPERSSGEAESTEAVVGLMSYGRNEAGIIAMQRLSKLHKGRGSQGQQPDYRGLSKEEVAARAGYEANGGGFNNALGRLRTLELIEGRGELSASDNLFETQ